MEFPVYVFDGSTNYTAVEQTVKEMVSYIDSISDCCSTSGLQGLTTRISFKLQAIQYNSADDLNNLERWKAGLKACYLLLYPLT